MAANYLKQIRTTAQRAKMLPTDKAASEANFAESDQSMRIFNQITDYRNLPQMQVKRKKGVKSFDTGSFTVLPSSRTRLCGCFINPLAEKMFTVDIDCLVRMWDLNTGVCIKSYPLEKPRKPGEGNMDDNLSHFKVTKQIQALKLSPDFKYLAVGFQGGHVQINNINSGDVLYNKAVENMLDLGP